MTEIITATYKFLDDLNESELIKKLTFFKNKLMHNKELLTEIDALKKETVNDIIIAKRKNIFKNEDYKMYMQYYNELSLIALRINKQYAKYTNTRKHNCN